MCHYSFTLSSFFFLSFFFFFFFPLFFLNVQTNNPLTKPFKVQKEKEDDQVQRMPWDSVASEIETWICAIKACSDEIFSAESRLGEEIQIQIHKIKALSKTPPHGRRLVPPKIAGALAEPQELLVRDFGKSPTLPLPRAIWFHRGFGTADGDLDG